MPHSGSSFSMNPAVARMKEQMANAAPEAIEQAQPDSPVSGLASVTITPSEAGFSVLCNYGDGRSEEKVFEDGQAAIEFVGDKLGGNYAGGVEEAAPGDGDSGAQPGEALPEE